MVILDILNANSANVLGFRNRVTRTQGFALIVKTEEEETIVNCKL